MDNENDKLKKLGLNLKVCNLLMELEHIDDDAKEFIQNTIYDALNLVQDNA